MDNRQLKILDNGLRLVTIKNDNLNSVVIRVGVKVGSRNEPEGVYGVSHFVEHVLFKGTKKRPTNKDISGVIDRYGGEHNAFTSKESTEFYIRIAKPYAAIALDIIHDLIKNPLLKTSDINKERSVIRDELSMYENSPDHCMWELSERLIYAGTSLARPIGGTRESVGFSANKLREFFSQHYVPSRMVVALSGAIDDKLISAAEKKFKTLGGEFGGMEIPEMDSGVEMVFGNHQFSSSHTDKAHILINLPGAPRYSKDYKYLHMISSMLGTGSSSRLFQSLREKKGLCYSIGAFQHSYVDAGSLCINTTVELDKMEQAIDLILKEIKSARVKGFTDDEIKAEKANMKGTKLLSLDSPMTHAAIAIDQLLFNGSLKDPDADVKEYMKINKKDIKRICDEYLNFDETNEFNITIVGPESAQDQANNLLNKFR